MAYSINITRSAHSDILSAYRYISVMLQNQKAADDLLDAVSHTIRSLSEYPDRYGLVSDPVLRSWNIRSIRIRNYIVFYTIDDQKKAVFITRFLFFRRNWSSILVDDDPRPEE